METVLRKTSGNLVSCWKVPSSVQTWDVATYFTPDIPGFLKYFLDSSQQDLLGLFLRQEFEGEVSCLSRGISPLALLLLLEKKKKEKSASLRECPYFLCKMIDKIFISVPHRPLATT